MPTTAPNTAKTLPAALVAAFALTSGLAHASTPASQACTPVIRDAWVRLPPGPMPMAAAYARVDNPCAKASTVTGAASDAFGDVSLHETRVVDGVSRMRAVERLPLPARGTTTLQPGGLHLMLMQPRAPLKAGQRLPIDLLLEDGTRVRAAFDVRAAAP